MRVKNAKFGLESRAPQETTTTPTTIIPTATCTSIGGTCENRNAASGSECHHHHHHQYRLPPQSVSKSVLDNHYHNQISIEPRIASIIKRRSCSNRSKSYFVHSKYRQQCTMICTTLIQILFTTTICCIAAQATATTTTTQKADPSPHQQPQQQPPHPVSGGGGDQKPIAAAAAASASQREDGVEIKLLQNHVHKLMSEQDLRRTFQVATHEQVPEYEITKLTVQPDGSHLISPISDLGEFIETTTNLHYVDDSSRIQSRNQNENLNELNHVKHKTKRSADALSAGATATSGSDSRSSSNNDNHNQEADDDDEDKLIVMNLSTFGRDFKLRLKRNVDFQQKIKDMKMFMAESTQDGQLKYTEIKLSQPTGSKQSEPHKRAATPDASDAEGGDGSASHKRKPQKATGGGTGGGDNFGSTYHDEDNLAALLIDQDTATGRLRVDGTIGNDFVIKPMPQATIEALLKHKLEQQQQQQQVPQTGASSASLKRTIQHMHDDDPHDDDEMFLDEDEALELANLQSAAQAIESNHTSAPNSAATKPATKLSQQQQQQPHSPRAISKSASERKWRKYRKLMAQTQVPKPSALAAESSNEPSKPTSSFTSTLAASSAAAAAASTETETPSTTTTTTNSPTPSKSTSPSSSATTRARRHAHPTAGARGRAGQQREIHLSHHIIYRQKPSSEGSSSEHQHSFMLAPQLYEGGGDQMEKLATSFSAQRLTKRAAAAAATGQGHDSRTSYELEEDSNNQESLTDFQEDPLGGQFYLEPGIVTGYERAGYSDWSLINQSPATNNHRYAPPYATNHPHNQISANGSAIPSHQHQHQINSNSTTDPDHAHSRHKRHAPRLQYNQQQQQHHTAGGPMRARGSQIRHKRQAPDTVWPEVLLVVDYDSFLLHGGDSRDVKRYFVSFWNGVDLRYKLLVHPHIRISLAGMIVAKDRDATPYLERNRLRAPNADAVDAAGALTDMGKYLYREDRLPTYDLAVVITKLDMCRRRYEGGRCNRGTAGFAYVGGACVVNKRLEKVNSVAIIEDSGGFSGIIVAAHEVGHLLGCVHDGSPPPSYLGGPGATHCPWEDGFIMSDLRHTERGFRWSQCSVEQFKHFLNGETATCLYNYPHESQMLHRLLPGTMLSLDDQCKRDRGTNACFKDARVCAQLFCFDSASGYCVSYRPAAEGSPCGEGQVCRNGKCVGEIENIIPDYTHQSQTVIARRPSSHSVTRLADNGLSASSTSLATSSPDGTGKLVVASGIGGSVAAGGVASSSPSRPATLSSRMDTFPVDTPLASRSGSVGRNPYTSFGGRYPQQQQQQHHQQQSHSDHHSGYMMMRQASSSNPSTSTGLLTSASSASTMAKSARLMTNHQQHSTPSASSATSGKPNKRHLHQPQHHHQPYG